MNRIVKANKSEPPYITDIKQKQKQMILALSRNLGNITKSCMEVGINNGIHNRWLSKFPDYKTDFEGVIDVMIDFAESELFNQIKAGSTPATIFFLKQKGANRGYGDKSVIDQTPITGIKLVVEDTIDEAEVIDD